ncbi:unnamed protein product [Schistosoma turkestanicum]|nr:unnamed protein product [Schistosoma turkestanicum]
MRELLWFLLVCASLNASVFAVLLVRNLSSRTSVEEFKDSEANFGKSIPYGSLILGRIHASQPIDGCEDSIPLPTNASDSTLPYISLIKRGNCSFAAKALAAEKGGYIAAVIFNDVDDSIFPMDGNSSTVVTIPAVMVGLSDGELLLTKYCKPYYFIEILPTHRPTIMLYLIPLITCLVISVVAVSVAFGVRLWNRYRRRHRYCLAVKELLKIPETVFTKDSSEFETCVICLEDYEDNDKLRVLPCKHAYHSKCVDQWLLKRRSCCPICKKKIHNTHTRFTRASVYGTTSEAPLLDDYSSFEEDSDSEDSSISSPQFNSSYGMDEHTPLINASANQSNALSHKQTKITASIRETVEGLLANVSSSNLRGCTSSECEQRTKNVNSVEKLQPECSQIGAESFVTGKQCAENDTDSESINEINDYQSPSAMITHVEVHTNCDLSDKHESHV